VARNVQTGAQRKCAERDLTPGEGESNATAQVHGWSRSMNRLRRSDTGLKTKRPERLRAESF